MEKYNSQNIAPHIQKRFEKLQKIGSGAYGYVWKVRQRRTNQIYALKKVFLAFQNDIDAQRTFRQISILKQLNHPNIIKLQQVIQAQNNLDLYLLFQFIQSDLFNAIRDGVLNQTHKKYIVYQLAKTLTYLHTSGILHRDLKPSNILIDSNCKIKICDFGLSRTLHHYQGQPPHMTQFIATRWYRAPQVLLGSTEYSYKSDMWSLGCLIYQIFAAKSLLPGNDSLHQIQKLLQFKGFPTQQQKSDLNVNRLQILLSHFKTKQLPQNHYFKPGWNPHLTTMLKGLLQYSPLKRWNSQQLLSSQFLSQFTNYQPTQIPQKQIILRINDNKKHNKDFYRNFIHKIFTKKLTSIHLQKSIPLTQHTSTSNTKRISDHTMRKKMNRNSHGSISFHTNSKIGSRKSLSKTIHMTSSRNLSIQLKKLQKQTKPNINSPYELKLKQNKQNNNYSSHKNIHISNHHNIYKQALQKITNTIKQVYKQQHNSKKILKKKVMIYSHNI